MDMTYYLKLQTLDVRDVCEHSDSRISQEVILAVPCEYFTYENICVAFNHFRFQC